MSTSDNLKNLPDYERPPVIEVVCGVLFKSLTSMTAPHLGVLWDKFKKDYPKVQEATPLAPVIEGFDGPPKPSKVELTDVPPLPRIWFESATGNGLIQAQRDRFHFNWRRIREEDQYPHYDSVMNGFCEHLAVFEEFLKENDLGSLDVKQCELTYVNHIPRNGLWTSLCEVGRVFPDFSWRTKERFLPELERLNCQTSFLLPEQSGRLHVTMRHGTRRADNVPVLFLELTARGALPNETSAWMWKWFDLAHTWIVSAFADLTSEEAQAIWRRVK
jgi:uncharacterized protein (TIGR04255 family)